MGLGMLSGMLAGFMATEAQAQTEVISVFHLPLAEAQDAVRSQLSAQGTVVSMPSRRILVVDDDAAHVRKAKELLSKLDQPLVQYRAMVEIISKQSSSANALSVSGAAGLKGGWVQVRMDDGSSRNSSTQSYQLQVSSGSPGHIEAGQVYILPSTRVWLQGLGIVDSATQVPITGGFDIVVESAGAGMAHVRVRPWLSQLQQGTVSGSNELLLDMGSAANPATPPGNPANAPVRLNAQPQMATQNQRIDVLGAATELTIPLDQEISIAAVNGDAREMARALLYGRSQAGSQEMVIRLRLHRF